MIFKNHTDQTYQLLAEFKRSPAPVDKPQAWVKIYHVLNDFQKSYGSDLPTFSRIQKKSGPSGQVLKK